MPIQNISAARVWYGGSHDQLDVNTHQILDETFSISSQMILTTNQQLQLGENFLFVTYDISCFPEIINSFVESEFLGMTIDNQIFNALTPAGTRNITGNYINSTFNLVPNPSFELADTCPDLDGQIRRAASWENMDYSTTLQFQKGTPDFFHPCATNNWQSNVWQIAFNIENRIALIIDLACDKKLFQESLLIKRYI